MLPGGCWARPGRHSGVHGGKPACTGRVASQEPCSFLKAAKSLKESGGRQGALGDGQGILLRSTHQVDVVMVCSCCHLSGRLGLLQSLSQSPGLFLAESLLPLSMLILKERVKGWTCLRPLSVGDAQLLAECGWGLAQSMDWRVKGDGHGWC